MAIIETFLQDIGCMRSNEVCILSISLIVLIDVLMVPSCIYITYKFYCIGHDQVNFHRHPIAVIIISILNILYIFIVDQYEIILNGITDKVSIWITSVVDKPFFLMILIIGVFRIWLINYDINYAIIQSRQNWQLLLSSTVNDEWYSRNRHKWGNYRYLLKIIFCIWIILSILCIIPLLLEHFNIIKHAFRTSEIVYFLVLIMLLLFVVFIWYKTPHFDDCFFIFKEIKLLIQADIICCIIWFSLIYFVQSGNIFAVIQIFMTVVFNFIQIFISEFIVIYYIKNKINRPNNNTKNVKNAKNIKNAKLFAAIISSDIGIEQYAKHLQHEFCMENLLFFLEIMQWIYTVTEQKWYKYDVSPLSTSNIKYTFAKIIPISSINNDTETDWYFKIEKIYKKYVDTSAEHQINVPYRIRTEFQTLLQLYDIKKQIEAKVYEPKLVRKSHVQNRYSRTSSFWNQSKTKLWTFRKHKIPKPEQNRTLTSTQLVMDINNTGSNLDQIKYSHSLQPISITVNKSINNNNNKTVTDDIGAIKFPARSHTTPISFAKKGKSNESLELENIFDDVMISADTDAPSKQKMKSVSFADQKAEDDNTEIKTKPLESITPDTTMTSVPSLTDSDEITDIEAPKDADSKLKIKMDTINEKKQSLTLKTQKNVTSGHSALGEIDEEKEQKFSDDTALSITPKLPHYPSVPMEEFLEDVLDGIDIGHDGKTKNKVKGIDIEFTTLDNLNSVSRSNIFNGGVSYGYDTENEIETMATSEYNYNVKRNLEKNMRRSNLLGKQFSKLTSLFAQKSQRSITRQLSEFADDEKCQSEYEITKPEQEKMELAKSIRITHFITISCFAVNEILQLNYQSIQRFKKSKYFNTFNQNVNLNQLIQDNAL